MAVVPALASSRPPTPPIPDGQPGGGEGRYRADPALLDRMLGADPLARHHSASRCPVFHASARGHQNTAIAAWSVSATSASVDRPNSTKRIATRLIVA